MKTINNMSDGLINILIVDDKPENLCTLKGFPESKECKFIIAKSGIEALDFIRKNDFALVLFDLEMLGTNYFQTAEMIRINRETKLIPIIFLTPNSIEQWSVFKGYELGAIDYLLKPVEPVLFRSKFRVFLDLYKQKRLLKIQAELLEAKANELNVLKKVNFHLENLSLLDGLTGIPNRRNFNQFIKMTWKNALREQRPLSLVMADIDFFKVYNDNYGHLQGDECLVNVANTLVSSIKRPVDLVARYGGEEFIAVLPNTKKEGAVLVAERMRKSIERLAIMHEGSQIANCVTISLGVGTIIPQVSDSLESFINSVDDALYQAKREGRNKVYIDDKIHLKNKSSPLSLRQTISGVWHSKCDQAKGILEQVLGA